MLAVLGGVAGVLLAWWTLPMLVASAPTGVPRLETATLNLPGTRRGNGAGRYQHGAGRTAARDADDPTRRDLREELGEGKGTPGGAVRPWVRQTLIASQAALVLIVLAGAALLVRSAINLQAVPIGFDTTGVLSARVALPAAQYAEPAHAKSDVRHDPRAPVERAGRRGAALDSQPPLLGGGGIERLDSRGPSRRTWRASSTATRISSRPTYFKVLRIPLKAGRDFTEQDLRSAPLVMIVNETLAREAFQGQDPIGKRISLLRGRPRQTILEDGRWCRRRRAVARAGGSPPRPEFYLPVMQIPDVAWTWIGRTMNVMARSAGGDPAVLTAPGSAGREGCRSHTAGFRAFGRWTKDCARRWRRRVSTPC